jgi:hypothetical protein
MKHFVLIKGTVKISADTKEDFEEVKRTFGEALNVWRKWHSLKRSGKFNIEFNFEEVSANVESIIKEATHGNKARRSKARNRKNLQRQ